MRIDPIKLIDAVADGVNNNVTLPEHRTLRYVEPRGLTEEMAPALTVYPEVLTYQTTLTHQAEVHGISLKVEWHERAAYGATTHGVGDANLAKQALARATDIGDLLAAWVDGVPTYKAALLSVRRADLGLTDGLLWSAEWTCQVDTI